MKYRFSIARFGLGLVLAVSLGLSSATRAAPGDLAQLPLFLGTDVPPNIFFVLDDSVRMDWEILRSRDAAAAHPAYDDEGTTTHPPTSDEQILQHCVGYNALAYDPAATYTPWEGVDDAGIAYADLTLGSARDNPFLAASTVDIGSRLYFVWTDSDGDGDYDVGECTRPDPAAFGGDIDASDCGTPAAPGAAGCVSASSLDANGQVNFANWYSYYRKREHVLKRTVSSAINGSSVRMGMASLRNTGNVSTEITDMSAQANTLIDGCTGFNPPMTNKVCMLWKLFQMQSGPAGDGNPLATPLRQGLDSAGRYFQEGEDHPFLAGSPQPILGAGQGGSCQHNFAVLVSYGNWNRPLSWAHAGIDHDSDGPGDWDGGAQADGAPAPPDAPATCDRPSTWPITSAFPFPGSVDTLADIAMYYYETDLNTSLGDNVNPIPGVDENPQQHMVTFTIALGGEGHLTGNPPNRTDPFPWPPICPDTFWTLDDMRHAAWNGRGQYIAGNDPTALSQALSNVVSTIAQRQVTSSEIAFNSTSLSTDTLLFQATFDSTDWSGDLLAYDADALLADIQSDGKIDISPEWRAAEELDGLTDAQAVQRIVLTRGNTGGGVAAATWADLTAAQQSDLRTNNTGIQDADAVGQARLDYLLGDRSCEVGASGTCNTDINADGNLDSLDKSLRQRGSRLGDIVNAGPVVVGVPELDWPSTAPFPDGSNGTTYTEFKTALTNSPRTQVVYVGANDGMLHGFRTSDGEEVVAYLPASLASTSVNEGYHRLSDPLYTHRFYVDRTPAVSDAFIDTGAGSASWRTLAVGGLGAGGRGLYALDITDPSSFTTANAGDILLWEFTDGNDAELGFTVSEPIIAMMNNGEWAAIVGSGYNDNGPDPDAHLFVLFLEEGLDGVWTIDSDYLRLEAPEAAATLADRNGLSSPTVADLDGNGTADRVYAGDLFGNLWAFDVCDADASGVCSTSPADWQTANTGLSPLFTAEVTGQRQPITHKPVIAKHPSEPDTAGNQPNVMVYFGTGQYLSNADLSNTDPQSFYGIWDSGALLRTRDDLQEQTFDSDFANDEVLTDNAVNWSTQFGWYIDLPDAGERVVVDPVLRSTIVFFNSLIPSTSECAGGGVSFRYAVDMETGGRPDFAPFDNNNDGVVDTNDLATPTSGGSNQAVSRQVIAGGTGGIATASKFMGNMALTGMSTTGIDTMIVFPLENRDQGRLSWKELNPF